MSPINAGMPWKKSALIVAVKAPKIPAIKIQAKKNNKTGSPCVDGSNKPHTRPAARKPLYKPWLAAADFVCLANSGVTPKTLFALDVSQKNISRIMM